MLSAFAGVNTAAVCDFIQRIAAVQGFSEISGSVGSLIFVNIFCFPVALLAILIIGWPLTVLTRQWYRDWWMLPAAVGLGALGGALVMLPIVASLCTDMWRPGMLSCKLTVTEAVPYLGTMVGAPTGFWWWFFYRRVLRRREALAVDGG